jgi:hypothetical protein
MAVTNLGTGLDQNVLSFHLKRLDLYQLKYDESLSLPKRVGSLFSSTFEEETRGKALLKAQSHNSILLERHITNYPKSISWMFHFYMARNAIIAGNYQLALQYGHHLPSKKGLQVDLLKGVLAQINGETAKASKIYFKVISKSEDTYKDDGTYTLPRILLANFAQTPEGLPRMNVEEYDNSLLLSDVDLKASCARDIYLSNPNDAETITKALEKAPKKEKWKYQWYLAQNHLDNNDLRKADSILDRISWKYCNPWVNLLKGEVLFRQKKYVQSYKILQKIRGPARFKTAVLNRAIFMQNKCMKQMKNKKRYTQKKLQAIVLYYPFSQWHLKYMSLVKDTLFEREFVERLANENNPWAMYVLGKYADSDQTKVAWFKKAADQGLALAQTNLGICYERGKGVKNDEKEAARLYQKAANQGFALAQYKLAFCYQFGKGVEKDEKEAARLYQKVEEQGCLETFKHNIFYGRDISTGVVI